ncbi:MAG: ScyD/ScyE family protein [Actinomycetota bacterium]
MSSTRTPLRGSFLWLALAVVASLATPLSAGAVEPTIKVIASGLDNPRGIDVRPGGAVLVAEAGKGGKGPCVPGPEGDACFGLTGALARVTRSGWSRLVDELPSHAAPDGSGALGPHDVSKDDAKVFATIGLGGDVAYRDGFGPGAEMFGTLVRWTRSRGVHVVADLAAYEEANDPNGDGADSNPYGLLRIGDTSIVTDAGGNSLLRVTDGGRISTIAVFPSRTVPFDGGEFSMDAVPTSVVKGPDGAFYVGQLTGFPFPRRGARVWRVEPGEDPTVYARGFTNIIDIAFDEDGNLFVLEISHLGLLDPSPPVGALIRVTPGGDKQVLMTDGLIFPTSFELARGGERVFLTNCGVCPGGGEVWRVDL